MSRARHKKDSKPAAYSAANSKVEKDAYKRGGSVKEVDMPEGKKPKHRGDKRPRKACGGGMTAKSPFSSAGSPKPNTEA